MGAGPAGLTAAWELMKHHVPTTVLEKDARYVGGIAGPTSTRAIASTSAATASSPRARRSKTLWREILGDELLDPRAPVAGSTTTASSSHYPLKAVQRPRGSSGRSRRCCACRATRRRGSARSRTRRSFEDWVRQPVRPAPLRDLLQDLHREGLGDAAPKELSADWAAQRIKGLDLWVGHPQRPAAEPPAEQEGRGHQDPDRQVPLPAPRPRPDVGERAPRPGRGARQPVLHGPRAAAASSTTAGRSRSVVTRDRGRQGGRRYKGAHFISTHADPRAGPDCWIPPPPTTCARRPPSLSLPRLPHGRPDRRPPGRLPGQLDLHPRPERQGRPDPELQELVAPTWCPTRPRRSLGLEYFCFEGDDLWTMPDADLIELGRRELGAARPRHAADVVFDGVRGAAAEGVPGLRRRLPGPPRGDPRTGSRHAAQPAPGGPERHAQVQQPGPLDDDRAPGGAEHRDRARASTPGRSTPTPSITRTCESGRRTLRDVRCPPESRKTYAVFGLAKFAATKLAIASTPNSSACL